ncbi:MAG TPA: hypothetical protein VNH40_12865, partial [Gaiellaceae bacterium]|nr:hypothetical protein [Gaiellaceae bacterium]
MAATPASGDRARPAHGRLSLEPRLVVRGAVVVGLLAVALFVLPEIAGADWITTFTNVAIYSVVAL